MAQLSGFERIQQINLRGLRVFEERFSREIFIGERLILSLLAVIFFCIALWFLAMPVVFPDEFREFHRPILGLTVGGWFSLSFAAAGTFDLVLQFLYGRLIATNRPYPVVFGFINAFVEISVISLAVFMTAKVYQPVYALFVPIVFFYFIFIFLQAIRLDFILCLFAGMVAAVQYWILSAVLVAEVPAAIGENPVLVSTVQHLARSVILLAGGLVAGFISWQIRKRLSIAYRSLQEKEQILDLFGQHVSPSVVKRLMETREGLESERRRVYVMFLDIRNFTGFSEGKEPEEIVRFLDDLFGFMIDIVNRNGGIINKFLGDGFMAVFGAPVAEGRDGVNAITAAREIAAALEEKIESGEVPSVKIGIGLHGGVVVTGTIGSSRRREYTIIGEAVNLASRIEKLNKRFGTSIIVSEEVLKEAVGLDCEYSDLGRIMVRGLSKPVRLFSIE